ncbi:hypothetical protein GCM10027396_28000 [Insolitispirillum peregrinum]
MRDIPLLTLDKHAIPQAVLGGQGIPEQMGGGKGDAINHRSSLAIRQKQLPRDCQPRLARTPTDPRRYTVEQKEMPPEQMARRGQKHCYANKERAGQAASKRRAVP